MDQYHSSSHPFLIIIYSPPIVRHYTIYAAEKFSLNNPRNRAISRCFDLLNASSDNERCTCCYGRNYKTMGNFEMINYWKWYRSYHHLSEQSVQNTENHDQDRQFHCLISNRTLPCRCTVLIITAGA
jgi:hypothetical protein